MSAFDDIEIGRRDDLGTYRFDASEVEDFVRRFDPRLMRSEAETDGEGPLASPWHVAAAFMPLNVAFQKEKNELAFGPSPGVSDMAWHRTVRTGETLRYTQTVIDKRRTARREGWGLLTTHIEARDEAGELVFSMTGRVLVRSD